MFTTCWYTRCSFVFAIEYSKLPASAFEVIICLALFPRIVHIGDRICSSKIHTYCVHFIERFAFLLL